MAELESEGQMTRHQVATFLREFAQELDGVHDGDESLVGDDGLEEYERRERSGERFDDGDDRRRRDRNEDQLDEHVDQHGDARRITLIVGGDSATVTVPDTLEFDVEVGSRSPMLSSGVHQEIEFELSWEIENPEEHGDESIAVE